MTVPSPTRFLVVARLRLPHRLRRPVPHLPSCRTTYRRLPHIPAFVATRAHAARTIRPARYRRRHCGLPYIPLLRAFSHSFLLPYALPRRTLRAVYRRHYPPSCCGSSTAADSRAVRGMTLPHALLPCCRWPVHAAARIRASPAHLCRRHALPYLPAARSALARTLPGRRLHARGCSPGERRGRARTGGCLPPALLT